jgi:hypothetical protein
MIDVKNCLLKNSCLVSYPPTDLAKNLKGNFFPAGLNSGRLKEKEDGQDEELP